VQLVVLGSHDDHFVAWRDKLLADPALRLEYDALKLRHDGRSMAEYRAAKSALIEKVLATR
jgi:GrpB-like predicted nucleotidyltransferase (UPF0157 family)